MMYTMLSISYLPLLYIISLPSFVTLMSFFFNKGHLLLALLFLEAATASLLPVLLLNNNLLGVSSILIFVFTVVVVCEACMGLASLLSSVRLTSLEMTSSSFFTN